MRISGGVESMINKNDDGNINNQLRKQRIKTKHKTIRVIDQSGQKSALTNNAPPSLSIG